jgi:hypothetical protein
LESAYTAFCQKVALNTAPAVDSMTGLGVPGNELIADLAKP